jgi:glycosyltransferase involved in cell wall biosynthesis
MKDQDFESYLEHKYSNAETVQALYLAHMMKEKGYWEVLELAQSTKDKNMHYNFAGSWKDQESEKEFFDFIQEHQLQNSISYHGFVSGEGKKELFEHAHILLYPSKNDAFPLTLLESLSFGVPILATDEGSIPYILDELSGIVIDDVQKLPTAFGEALGRFITVDTAQYCRQRYLENFTLEQFEENLIKVIS